MQFIVTTWTYHFGFENLRTTLELEFTCMVSLLTSLSSYMFVITVRLARVNRNLCLQKEWDTVLQTIPCVLLGSEFSGPCMPIHIYTRWSSAFIWKFRTYTSSWQKYFRNCVLYLFYDLQVAVGKQPKKQKSKTPEEDKPTSGVDEQAIPQKGNMVALRLHKHADETPRLVESLTSQISMSQWSGG